MKSYHFRSCLAASLCALIAAVAPARGITVGQVDDFEDGTTMDWRGNQAFNVDSEGPSGAGDMALRVDSFVRMIVVSDLIIDPEAPVRLPTQWTGNYTAAGVTAISMDVKNPNFYPLNMYLGIANETVSSLGSGATYVTDYSMTIPADDQWHNVTFPIAASDFIPSLANSEQPPVGAGAILQNVFQLRVFHTDEPGEFRGDAAIGHFFLDNITAEGSPTPADADFDGDNDVDGQDYLTWQRGLGVGTTQGAGDADLSGSVNNLDLAVWKSQFGPGATAASAAIPEPTAALLGVIAALAACALRRY